MLNVDFSKSFLSYELIKKVYELACHGTYTPESLIDSASRLIGVKFIAVQNTVSLLISSGLVIVSEEGYCNVPIKTSILESLIEYLSTNGILGTLASAIEVDDDLGGYKVNSFKLFPKYRGLTSLAVSLSIFSFNDAEYKLTKYGFELLNMDIFESSFSIYDDGISPLQLNARLDLQAERGDLAEEFVLHIEIRRLAKHEHIKAVKRISLSNVSAGFDIQSFQSDKSNKLDKFIEVKSYSGSPGFYWTLNEINVAKEKGEFYSLMIVDFNNINQDDYEPLEIRNPYLIFNMDKHIKKESNSSFEIEPQTFYISWEKD